MGGSSSTAAARAAAGSNNRRSTGATTMSRSSRSSAAQNWAQQQFPSSGGGAAAPAQQRVQQQTQQPQMQHTFTIRNDVNLKKNTLVLERNEHDPNLYTCGFTFDSSTNGTIEIYLGAQEVLENDNEIGFRAKYGQGCPPVKFGKGLGQLFKQPPEHSIVMSRIKKEDYSVNKETNTYPLVVRMRTHPPESADKSKTVQSQSTFAEFVSRDDGSVGIRVLKQKIQVGGMSYELQEIFGIENGQQASAADDDMGDGKECVICMAEPRDTTVLPCRHMCMCSECAKVLRFQTNKCPICRTNVESLLQIKVSKKSSKKKKEKERKEKEAAAASASGAS